MSVTNSHQIDVAKTRMQILGQLGSGERPKNSVALLRQMEKTEGIGSWWKGMTPALLRQATYGTLRYGMYEVRECRKKD